MEPLNQDYYETLCRNFFNASHIPIHLTNGGNAVYSWIGDMLSIPTVYHRDLFDANLTVNPCFCGDSPDIEYGRIHVEGTAFDVFIGPTFNVPITDQLIRQLMHEATLSFALREQVTELYMTIPPITHMQFAQYLIFFHQILNHKTISYHDLSQEGEAEAYDRKSKQVDQLVSEAETGRKHNTYDYELALYQKIKEGNLDKLNEFFTTQHLLVEDGKMAQSPLRHAKNVFITHAAKATFQGAIPGGVDIEKAYQLMESYIQECERLQNIDEITHLDYLMLTDFCKRAGETQLPEGITPDVYRCMSYIRSHTNEPLSVEEASAAVGRSASYMMKHFRDELGIHLGAYIMRCKLEEARSLLTYSDKSLADISNYLCFSSQSYFQNVFKKQYGKTPLQFRKQTR